MNHFATSATVLKDAEFRIVILNGAYRNEESILLSNNVFRGLIPTSLNQNDIWANR